MTSAPRSASIMPASGAVIIVPSSITRTPLSTSVKNVDPAGAYFDDVAAAALHLSPEGRGRNGRLAPISGEGVTDLHRGADPPHPDRASAIRPLPCGGLCVLGRLALVCRKALFLRREWPRIEPRTVFSTMFDHLRADSSLHRRCNGDCAPQIVAAAGKNDLHAVAHKRVKPHSAQPIMLLKN